MKKQTNKFLLILVSLLASFNLTACSTQSKDTAPAKTAVTTTPTSDTQFLMGTVCTIKIYNQHQQKALKAGFKRIKQLATETTVNQKGSEIDKINKYAGIKPVKVTPTIYRMCKDAYYYSKISAGTFDLTIGPITSLWRIGFPDAHKPKASTIKKRLPLINYHNVVFNDQKQTVFLKKKKMMLDLGGMAKGFISDEVMKVLQKNGVTSAIIDLGGNVYVMGNSPTNNSNWTVGIQDPSAARGDAIGSLPQKNATAVTSGIYERYLKVGNKVYSHLMNPQTGYPCQNNLLSVTIIAKRSTTGDGLSTAVFNRGLKKGYDYVEHKPGVEAIFITKKKKVYITSGLKNKFKLFSGNGYQLAKLKTNN
ncbi:FAD:protein FMN transferase [Lactobacillus sp. ESL0259]|uniref:FAD:protein FMN transferase n=1 Tax=Lactobacillus sp. ESL0259 TaxID=2069346 RepID=UPI000EFA6490|nr:FAD:protein FMN transferase [Lactobacillus sp. ESL0259]RMC62086.1 FAD:protein FMN transferase [Lactobacillus sp. ESL0259]